jgi:phospholipase/carboxylesterase
VRAPLLFGHGLYDPVVPFELGKAAHDRLERAGYTTRWAAFPMEHSLCLPEVQLIASWLAERFAAPSGG